MNKNTQTILKIVIIFFHKINIKLYSLQYSPIFHNSKLKIPNNIFEQKDRKYKIKKILN